jgi:hypothetical protein
MGGFGCDWACNLLYQYQHMKRYIARNLITGLYYTLLGCAFVGTLDQAALLDDIQAAVIRYTYANAVLIEVL